MKWNLGMKPCYWGEVLLFLVMKIHPHNPEKSIHIDKKGLFNKSILDAFVKKDNY